MKRKYYLITNVSNMKYWSYRDDDIHGNHGSTVAKWGTIYVNQQGGWFHEAAVKQVHEMREQVNFPIDNSSFV